MAFFGSLFGSSMTPEEQAMLAQLPPTPTGTTMAGQFDPTAAATATDTGLPSSSGLPPAAAALVAQLPPRPTALTAFGAPGTDTSQPDPIAAATATDTLKHSMTAGELAGALKDAASGLTDAGKLLPADASTSMPSWASAGSRAPQSKGAAPQVLANLIALAKQRQDQLAQFGLQQGAFQPRAPGGLLGRR